MERLPPTDDDIVADLEAQPAARWRELFAIADALTPADRQVTWGGGQELSPGVVQAPYPIYSVAVERIRELLPIAVFNWTRWREDSPLYPDGRGLDGAPVADAVRLATVYVRGERFVDGLLGAAIRNGALDAIVGRLRRWVESGG